MLNFNYIKSDLGINPQYLNKSDYYKIASESIIDRLEILDKDFKNVLNIRYQTDHLNDLLIQKIKPEKIDTIKLQELMSLNSDELSIYYRKQFFNKNKTYDLVTLSLGLHCVYDILGFLHFITKILVKDGIFISNFVGGPSLLNLRKKFIDIERILNYSHIKRVIPMIKFEDVSRLLVNSGFKEIIVDYDIIELQFKSVIDFIYELKNLGESFLVHRKKNAISKRMFLLLKDFSVVFDEKLMIISVIASPNKNSIRLA